jgi:hypothetical protein
MEEKNMTSFTNRRQFSRAVIHEKQLFLVQLLHEEKLTM